MARVEKKKRMKKTKGITKGIIGIVFFEANLCIDEGKMAHQLPSSYFS